MDKPVGLDLPPRDQRAIDLRKGGMVFREIGVALGRCDDPNIPIHRETARRIVCRAVRMLKHPDRKGHPDREWAEQVR